MSTIFLRKIQRKKEVFGRETFLSVLISLCTWCISHWILTCRLKEHSIGSPSFPSFNKLLFVFFFRSLFSKISVKALKLATPVRSWWGILRYIESVLEWPVSSLYSASWPWKSTTVKVVEPIFTMGESLWGSFHPSLYSEQHSRTSSTLQTLWLLSSSWNCWHRF